jgi:hypothetical protein
MKKLLFLFLLFWVSISYAADEVVVRKEPWDYSQVQCWAYSLSMDVVILMPEDYVMARNYYFDKNHPDYKDRDKIVAFTAWHLIDGKYRPVMFVQVRINLAPMNDDLGHEMKHIINYEHRKIYGVDRFMPPCSDWK